MDSATKPSKRPTVSATAQVVTSDQLAQILRVKTRRQRRRSNEVAEHHRQLSAFSVDRRG